MFALQLTSPNMRSGWFYSGSFVVTFNDTCNSLEKRLREIFFKDLPGFQIENEQLVCSHTTVFGADYEVLGKGVMVSNEKNTDLKIFLNYTSVRDITTSEGGILWSQRFS